VFLRIAAAEFTDAREVGGHRQRCKLGGFVASGVVAIPLMVVLSGASLGPPFGECLGLGGGFGGVHRGAASRWNHTCRAPGCVEPLPRLDRLWITRYF
jgi:hypothetical protein